MIDIPYTHLHADNSMVWHHAQEEACAAFARNEARFAWPRGSDFDRFVQERLRCSLEGPVACSLKDPVWCLLASSRLPVEEAYLLHGAGVLARHRWEFADQPLWTIRLAPLSTLRARASELHLWLGVRRLLDVIATGDGHGLAAGLVLQGAGAASCGRFPEWSALLRQWAREQAALGCPGRWSVWRSGSWRG